MKYLAAIILLAVALGAWGAAFGIYYGSSWGGTPEQPCSRSSC